MTTEQKKIQRKISKNFAQFLDDIKIARIKVGTDDKMQSDWRITLAISRHPALRKIIMEDVINTDLK